MLFGQKKLGADGDITAICVSAESFPEGVLAAHKKLHSLVTYSPDRKYFGISYPVGPGEIMYLAAEWREQDVPFWCLVDMQAGGLAWLPTIA